MRDKIYFASDFHLGFPNPAATHKREAYLVRWLDAIKADAAELYLVGDVFEFWYEYKTVVPRGYVRFLGKLAELTDSGVKLYFFRGNHDMWMRDYFVQELGATIISDELVMERGGRRFYIHHGDGLGVHDRKYKFLKKWFRNSACQWLLSRIHPNFTLSLGGQWSNQNRKANAIDEERKAAEQTWLVEYARELLQQEHFDYLIFGHRHVPMEVDLGNHSRYINLGEWMSARSYAVFDGTELHLRYFEKPGA